MANEREHGVVKWYSDQKGYGFIERDEGSDVYVHHSDIRGSGYRRLDEGYKVKFTLVEKEDKGPQAKDVITVRSFN